MASMGRREKRHFESLFLILFISPHLISGDGQHGREGDAVRATGRAAGVHRLAADPRRRTRLPTRLGADIRLPQTSPAGTCSGSLRSVISDLFSPSSQIHGSLTGVKYSLK